MTTVAAQFEHDSEADVFEAAVLSHPLRGQWRQEPPVQPSPDAGVQQGGTNSLGFFEFRRAKKRGSSSWAKATITGFGGKIKVEGLEGGEVGNSKRRERAI